MPARPQESTSPSSRERTNNQSPSARITLVDIKLHRQAVTAARTAAAISIDPCVSPSLWIPPSLTAYATAAYHPANTLISSSL